MTEKIPNSQSLFQIWPAAGVFCECICECLFQRRGALVFSIFRGFARTLGQNVGQREEFIPHRSVGCTCPYGWQQQHPAHTNTHTHTHTHTHTYTHTCTHKHTYTHIHTHTHTQAPAGESGQLGVDVFVDLLGTWDASVSSIKSVFVWYVCVTSSYVICHIIH